jgi:hypothetical protein
LHQAQEEADALKLHNGRTPRFFSPNLSLLVVSKLWFGIPLPTLQALHALERHAASLRTIACCMKSDASQ